MGDNSRAERLRSDDYFGKPSQTIDNEETRDPNWITAVSVFISVSVFFVGWCLLTDVNHDVSVWRNSSTEPNQMTLKELVDTGSPHNAHVRITNFKIGQPALQKSIQDENTKTSRNIWIFVPLLTPNAEEPTRTVIWAKKDPHSEDDLPNDQFVEGFLISKDRSIHEMAVQNCTPGRRADDILVINTNVSSKSETIWLIVLGFGLMMVGIIGFRFAMRFESRLAKRLELRRRQAESSTCSRISTASTE